MIYKTITLKFSDGRLLTVSIIANNEKDASIQINKLMNLKKAYGFSTQSSATGISK